MSTNGLSSCGHFILQVHGCIQQAKFIVSIYLSCKYNLINVTLAKKLHVLSKHILNTQVYGVSVKILKIAQGYGLYSNVFALLDFRMKVMKVVLKATEIFLENLL